MKKKFKPELIFDGEYSYLNPEPEPSWLHKLLAFFLATAVISAVAIVAVQIVRWFTK